MNHTLTLKLIQEWLKANGKTQAWLASQIGMSPALLSQVMNGNRKLQTKYMISTAKVMGIPLDQLLGIKTTDQSQPQIALRGHLSNRESKKQIDQLLLDIRHSVDLEATIHAK